MPCNKDRRAGLLNSSSAVTMGPFLRWQSSVYGSSSSRLTGMLMPAFCARVPQAWPEKCHW
ncbi:hypothetical protein BGY98DRAFT_984837 [Russula aff. rugulosa BPL654]|nr:hypothetical protein BGY98DRAFT_984837 [Russula aff. rugulosa BPL654]